MKKLLILACILIISLISLFSCDEKITYEEIEPPLTEKDLEKPVPDFLNEDQQLLFRRAKSVYSRLFSGSSGIAYGDVDGFGNEYENFKINGITYISNTTGRYRNYKDFEKLIKSIFVVEFWDVRNTESFRNKTYPMYTNCDGKLCYIDFMGSGGFSYNMNFYDEFELISKTDSEISFYAIGHYSWRHRIGEETIEQRDQRLKDEYEYTKKFLNTLVLTEEGWRFSEFADPVTDEGNYEGIYSPN